MIGAERFDGVTILGFARIALNSLYYICLSLQPPLSLSYFMLTRSGVLYVGGALLAGWTSAGILNSQYAKEANDEK